MNHPAPFPKLVRVKVALGGAVQGVGFRPFVHRLARELALTGWVNNSPQGVFLEAESSRPVLEEFLRRLQTEKPPPSFIQSLEATWLDAIGFNGFEIRPSATQGERSALVLPDLATCPDCRREIFDAANRRFRYPFTNCTHCGPRFSIIEGLPYDRANTTMKKFVMCPSCQAEYDQPADRRFHAQPNACPVCGPRLEFWNADGQVICGGDEALRAAAQAIRRGQIVAAKGIGGFHLLAAADNAAAIQRLRARKHREEKPFALLFPTLDCARAGLPRFRAGRTSALLAGRADCSAPAHRQSPMPDRPRGGPGQSEPGVDAARQSTASFANGGPGFSVVATSGNLSDEPLCTDEVEAVERLRGIADCFLVHNRPIRRHADDSIVRVVLGREMVLRRARGLAPLPIHVRSEGFAPSAIVLGVGAHLKNAVALAVGANVFISQHIGDLETVPAEQAFRRVIADFKRIYAAEPELVAADLHPDYLSTQVRLGTRAGGTIRV